MKNILITGSIGFIGYHLCRSFKDKKNLRLIGVDNINNYYSTKVKLCRLRVLKSQKNFFFKKKDISDYKSLEKIIKKYKIDTIINLAAQAGVAYSMKNPEKFFENNIKGFFNICRLSRMYNIKRVIYASSSSVYGDNKNLPVKENYETNPLNYYAISKENNEKTAKFFSEISKVKFIGLRFFSIYGPFGRPDMLIYKFINCMENKKIFYLNNFGNHSRDFTYIDDAIYLIKKLIDFKKVPNYSLFNICNSKSVKITNLLKIMKKNNIKPKIIKRKFQKGDIKDALGSNKELKKIISNYKFMKFENGLQRTIDWYKENKKIYN